MRFEHGEVLICKEGGWTYGGLTLSINGKVTYERMGGDDKVIVRVHTGGLMAVDEACIELAPTAEELAEVYRILGVNQTEEV